MTFNLAFKFAALTLLVIGHAQTTFAFQCSDLFRDQPVGRAEIARELLRQGSLGTGSYVSRWNVRNPEQAGPYPVSGEMMVTSVKSENFANWMETVGSRTIGLLVTDLPMDNPGTGGLRVGTTLHSYSGIRDGSPGTPMAMRRYGGYTEATFSVSPVEMRAIEQFLIDRATGVILAQHDIRNGPRAGQPIRPNFDIDGGTLTNESCAAASSCFLNPRWLEHYQSPNADILRNLSQRIGFQSTPVAKHFIWRNARNPNTLAITLFGHGSAPENFMRENEWGPLRGIPVYGFMPDPADGNTGTIQSRRISLTDWMASRSRRP